MLKISRRALAAALLLSPAASFATKIPIPIEGASANINMQVQPEFLLQEASAPSGDGASYDFFVRRTRIQFAGGLPNFDFYVNIDNGNFGKFGNFTSRVIVQDARASWAPWGQTGGNVLYVDLGLIQIPLSHYELGSTTNYITADQQTDTVRIPGSPLQAFRDTGVQIRGWAMDKKLGYRFGVWEGYQPVAATSCTPSTPGNCLNPTRNPAFRAFLNMALIGTEEGGYYYGGSYRWGKDPIVSVNASGNYQSKVLRNAFASLTDQKLMGAGVYLDFPVGDTELVAEGTASFAGNGTGSANTGLGLSGNLGYRFHNVAPYIAYDYFQSGSCDPGALSAAQLTLCNATVDTANSRNLKVGLNIFINKTLNHVYLEFQVNHGQSQFGPSSVTAASAGYVPLSLDPVAGSAARVAFNNKLATPAYRSLLVHWNFFF